MGFKSKTGIEIWLFDVSKDDLISLAFVLNGNIGIKGAFKLTGNQKESKKGLVIGVTQSGYSFSSFRFSKFDL